MPLEKVSNDQEKKKKVALGITKILKSKDNHDNFEN